MNDPFKSNSEPAPVSPKAGLGSQTEPPPDPSILEQLKALMGDEEAAVHVTPASKLRSEPDRDVSSQMSILEQLKALAEEMPALGTPVPTPNSLPGESKERLLKSAPLNTQPAMQADNEFGVRAPPFPLEQTEGTRDKEDSQGALSIGQHLPSRRAFLVGSAAMAICVAAVSTVVWYKTRRTAVVTLTGHSDEVASVAFSPDGRMLASGSFDGTIKLWEVSNGQMLQTLALGQSWCRSIAFSPDGRMLASGNYDKTIRLLDVTNGRVLQSLNGHSDQVLSIAFSPDGRILASGSADNTIRLWDVANGQPLQALNGPSSEWSKWVTSVAFSPDGRTLASGDGQLITKVWNVPSGKLLQTLVGTPLSDGSQPEVFISSESVAFSPDGRVLVSGGGDGTIRVWDMMTGQLLQTMTKHSLGVSSIACSPNGRMLASGNYDKTIGLWDITSGQLLQTLDGHIDEVLSVAFSPDGETLASGSRDQTIKLWDVTNVHT